MPKYSDNVYYRKQGRRYVPVSEYDQELLDSYPYGATLVLVQRGSTSRKFHIDPDYAAMIAAGEVAKDAISTAIVKASESRPTRKELTPEQIKAWQKLAKALGDERSSLEIPSAREVAEAGVAAMREEAEKLMKNESVRQAYEQFLMVCALTKTQQNQ